jgi:hypothetical protein
MEDRPHEAGVFGLAGLFLCHGGGSGKYGKEEKCWVRMKHDWLLLLCCRADPVEGME